MATAAIHDIGLRKETETPGSPEGMVHCAYQRKQYEIRPVSFRRIACQGSEIDKLLNAVVTAAIDASNPINCTVRAGSPSVLAAVPFPAAPSQRIRQRA
jgi:hypothetical protein